ENDPLGQGYLYPLTRTHSFGHTRDVEVQYNPFEFFSLGYRSNVRQSLNTAGVNVLTRTLIQRRDDPDRFQEYEGLDFDEIFDFEINEATGDTTLIGPGFDDFGITSLNELGLITDYEVTDARVIPAQDVFSDVLNGERDVLTDQYQQNLTATLQSPFDRVQALRWLRLQPLSFSSNFTWQNTPLPGVAPEDRADTTQVAALANQATLRGGLALGLRDLFEKIPLYRRVREAQEDAQQDAQQGRSAFEARLEAYRQRQDAVDEAEEALRDAEARAATDSTVTEDLITALRQELETARAVADTTARPSPPLPIPNPLGLLRRGFLALTGPRELSVTYNGSFGATNAGVDSLGYSLFDAVFGGGPSLGYRLGLDRRLPLENRFEGVPGAATVQVRDQLTDDHQISARTTLDFSDAFRIDLNWDFGLRNRETLTYTREFDDGLGSEFWNTVSTGDGSGRTTVFALGGSYEDFYALHRDRLLDDVESSAQNDTLSANQVLTDALTPNGVVADFRSAFVSGFGGYGRGGFVPFPLPNWRFTYSGLSNWPLIRALTQSASLTHGYSAVYEADFRSDQLAGQLNESALPFLNTDQAPGTYRLLSRFPEYEAQGVRISRRYQPLVGVNLNFKGGFQTDLAWNESTTLTLSPANFSLRELDTRELSLRLSVNKTGFRLPIPFLRRRLNNNLRLSLIVSQAENVNRQFLLRTDLQQELERAITETFLNPTPEATTRLSVEPQLSYTISNQVTAGVFVRYEKFDSEGSRNPPTTTLNGGFNFRVSFSN
ncbi:MAG: cell surface protein SprA, partial [Rhodothermales bacterium]|nr:cell surface protein SprA [Rhodothermales bacterium]